MPGVRLRALDEPLLDRAVRPRARLAAGPTIDPLSNEPARPTEIGDRPLARVVADEGVPDLARRLERRRRVVGPRRRVVAVAHPDPNREAGRGRVLRRRQEAVRAEV